MSRLRMKCDLCTSNLDVFGWASQIQLRRIASSTLQAMDAFTVWSQLLVSTPFSLSMCPPTHVPLNATADAMASKDMAGSGSAAVFPDRSVVWFRFRIHLFGVQSTWDWIGDDMQKHIAAWELFAQYALSYCIESRLPKSRGPISCNQATGNSGRCSIIQLADHAYVRELDRCCSLVRNPPRFFLQNIVLNQNLFWFSWVCPFSVVSQRVILFRAAILGQVVVFWVDRCSTFLSPFSTTIPIQPSFFPCWRDRLQVSHHSTAVDLVLWVH